MKITHFRWTTNCAGYHEAIQMWQWWVFIIVTFIIEKLELKPIIKSISCKTNCEVKSRAKAFSEANWAFFAFFAMLLIKAVCAGRCNQFELRSPFQQNDYFLQQMIKAWELTFAMCITDYFPQAFHEQNISYYHDCYYYDYIILSLNHSHNLEMPPNKE